MVLRVSGVVLLIAVVLAVASRFAAEEIGVYVIGRAPAVAETVAAAGFGTTINYDFNLLRKFAEQFLQSPDIPAHSHVAVRVSPAALEPDKLGGASSAASSFLKIVWTP